MSHHEFVDKICPYESIIPHHLYKEVIEFHRKGTFTLPKTISFELV